VGWFRLVCVLKNEVIEGCEGCEGGANRREDGGLMRARRRVEGAFDGGLVEASGEKADVMSGCEGSGVG
jgi:hypothetical protein